MGLRRKISITSAIISYPLKVFRCVCFIHIPKHRRDKLDPRAVKGIFMGYSSNQKGYKCYVPQKGEKYYVTMDVTFFEDLPSSKGNEISEPNRQGEPPTLVEDVQPPSHPNPTPSSPQPVPSERAHSCRSTAKPLKSLLQEKKQI